MKWLSIVLGLVTLGLIAGPVLSQDQAIQPIPTPAETVKAFGKISVTEIDLRGSSFAVFGSPTFQDVKIKHGHYNISTTSTNHISANLMDWANKTERIPESITDDKTTEKYINKTSPTPEALGSHYIPPPVMQMTPK
jgi:hypothetical protein